MQTQLSTLFMERTPVLFKKAQELSADIPSVFTTPILFTTICATEPPCNHCFWRSQSYINPRFWRKTEKSETIEMVTGATKLGVQRLLVPSGCIGSTLPQAYYDHVSLIKETAVAINPDIEIFGICGPISKESLKTLKSIGMDGFSASLEIPNEALFKKVRPGDSYTARVQTLKDAAELGLKLMTGFMYGLGESKEDIINGIRHLKQYELDSFSLSPYEQYPYIGLERRSSANLYNWARLTAITRLYFGKINIYTRPDYANWGFRGGANAVVPVIPNNDPAMLTMRDKGSRLTDELERMRQATYELKQ
jgi:biotin synthase